jgi:SpoIIAA-like
MVELIPGVPDDVLAIRGRGTITAADYESVIIPAVESKLATHGKLRFLYHLGPDFHDFAAGALWDDAKIGLAHFGAWERIAVVSDLEWVRGICRLFGLAMPGRVHVYRNAELENALTWISESS